MDSLSRNQFKRLVNAQDKELMELYEERAALRKLCRDMYPLAKAAGLDGRCTNPEGEDCHTPCDDCLYYSEPIHDRMETLGLLEGGDND